MFMENRILACPYFFLGFKSKGRSITQKTHPFRGRSLLVFYLGTRIPRI